MYIKEIELKNFRNYEEIKLQFHKKVNIFFGDNAQGKTNLLESIYVTSLGKSFRTTKESEMIRFGEEFCRIKVIAEKDEEPLNVEIAIGKEKKGIKIDGIKIKKVSELLENIFIVIFSPEDLKIVKEDPEKRRRFIDIELCQIKPSYYVSLSNYKKVLLHRNILLKNKNIDHRVLDVWDANLIEYGTKIMKNRSDFVRKVNNISREIHKKITNGTEKLEIFYESNVELKENLKEQQEIFNKALKDSISRDIFRGNTGTGPHRDDLKICINGVDIRHFGSQGQQRTAALSLKLAELKLIREETGENAILLLDDVLSELDSERQKFLINSLGDVQLFITTTEISENIKDKLPERYSFYVSKGTATEISCKIPNFDVQ